MYVLDVKRALWNISQKSPPSEDHQDHFLIINQQRNFYKSFCNARPDTLMSTMKIIAPYRNHNVEIAYLVLLIIHICAMDPSENKSM